MSFVHKVVPWLRQWKGCTLQQNERQNFSFALYCFVEKSTSDLLSKLNLRGKFFTKFVRAVSGTEGCELHH